MKLAVLASGRGSNFKAIASAVKSGRIPSTEVVGLLCSRAEAPAIGLAKELGVKCFVHPYQKKMDRTEYEMGLVKILEPLRPDYICLAGYMLLLGPTLLREYPKRILNIHPSLLPAFKGLHAQRQALEAGVEWTGCTVHWVTEKMDAGPALKQAKIRIEKQDTEESLSQRLLPLEHETYVEALMELAVNHVSKGG